MVMVMVRENGHSAGHRTAPFLVTSDARQYTPRRWERPVVGLRKGSVVAVRWPFILTPGIYLRRSPYGPMDKAPAYGAGDSEFESR